MEHVSFLEDLKKFPRYLTSYTFGFVHVAMTDLVITSLAIACALLGKITKPLVGITTFLFSFVGLKAVNSVSNAIVVAGNSINPPSKRVIDDEQDRT